MNIAIPESLRNYISECSADETSIFLMLTNGHAIRCSLSEDIDSVSKLLEKRLSAPCVIGVSRCGRVIIDEKTQLVIGVEIKALGFRIDFGEDEKL